MHAMIVYREAQKSDLPSLAEWLVHISQVPEQHCLHTWAGDSPAQLEKQLSGYLDDGELYYLFALDDDGRPVGAFGAEFDRELRRGWLHGPHAEAQDWETITKELYRKLTTALPEEISKLGAYLNVENTRGREFYLQHDFHEKDRLNYDFWMIQDRRVTPGDKLSQPLAKKQEPSFRRLYQQLFPRAYYSAERICQMNGQSHHVLVEAEGANVKGFVVATIPQAGESAEVQFLGVAQESRKQGIGRQLLLSITDWLFEACDASQISLNVDEELVHARQLYESAGFRLQYTGIGLEKTIDSPGEW